MSADPWRDLPVGNYFTRGRPGDLAEGTVAPSRRALRTYETQNRKDLAQGCANAWRDFGQQTGTHLAIEADGGAGDARTASPSPPTFAPSLRSRCG